MARDRFVRQSLGNLQPKVKEARVLLVGAGGIGCELLKNLVLTGFGEVHIVDLDTIDLSNLNRQFLFRNEHIKKSKAIVAKESASRFNPQVKLEAHHSNITAPEFNIDWFQQFNLVFNALDNLEARRHVNKMCLAAEVPLIESGTTGFNGQVQVIKKGKTECYDCNPKEVPKTFPVCTIRSTPSQPIHCIVWAKSYLFTEIFGMSEDETPDLDHSEDSENAQEIQNLKNEAQALQKIRQSIASSDFPRLIFEKVFRDDIDRLRGMEDMWKSRSKPKALDVDQLSKSIAALSISTIQDQKAWTQEESFAVFCDSTKRLSARLQALQASSPGQVLSFDKDDEDTLDFVAATANLRAIVFGIDTKSKFDIKQMAGNIIPAIATTNAMVAGLCVLQGFKILRDDFTKARNIFLDRSGTKVITAETLRPPNPDCSICGVKSGKIIVDPQRATLGDLVDTVLKKSFGYDEFSVSSQAGILYDPDLDDNLPKRLVDLSVKGDSFLTVVDDEDENPRVNLSLVVSEETIGADDDPIKLPTAFEIPRKTKEASSNTLTNGNVNGHVSNEAPPALKRKRSFEDTDGLPASASKKGKVITAQPTVIDDAPDGAILIDD